MDVVDWRTQLQPDSRQRILHKIMDTLKKHLSPFTGPERLHEIYTNAERFEEKMYTAATSQSDYLRKISLQMIRMEAKSQNTIPSQVGDSSRAPVQGIGTLDSVDWRTQLQPNNRQRIVNKIMGTLKKHLPFSGPEGLHEINRLAERFEEKIFTVATSQTDYLRKISLKMLTMETKSQNTMPDRVGNVKLEEKVYSASELEANDDL